MNVAKIETLLSEVSRLQNEPISPGATDAALKDCERRSGITLPESLRAWLRLTNGPLLAGGFCGTGNSHPFGIDECLKAHPAWAKNKWIPVALDGCGDYYLIPITHEFGEGNPVIFIDVHESVDAPSYVVASNLERFVIFLLERELGKRQWPFDERYVTSKDPEILRVKNVRLPWETV